MKTHYLLFISLAIFIFSCKKDKIATAVSTASIPSSIYGTYIRSYSNSIGGHGGGSYDVVPNDSFSVYFNHLPGFNFDSVIVEVNGEDLTIQPQTWRIQYWTQIVPIHQEPGTVTISGSGKYNDPSMTFTYYTVYQDSISPTNYYESISWSVSGSK